MTITAYVDGCYRNTISSMNAKVNPYQSVSIQPSLCACLAAQTLRNERFLCNEAPVFPLAECTQASDCGCKYKRWEDRRAEDRRAPFATAGDNYFANGNRRERSDRRSSQSIGTPAMVEPGEVREPATAPTATAPTATAPTAANKTAANKNWGLKSFIQAGLNGVLGQTKA